MSFISTPFDFDDFERFFYDQVSFKTDFFEEPNLKIVRIRFFNGYFNQKYVKYKKVT